MRKEEIELLKEIQSAGAMEIEKASERGKIALALEARGYVKITRVEENNILFVMLTDLGRKATRG